MFKINKILVRQLFVRNAENFAVQSTHTRLINRDASGIRKQKRSSKHAQRDFHDGPNERRLVV